MAKGLYLMRDGQVLVEYGKRRVPISPGQYRANGYRSVPRMSSGCTPDRRYKGGSSGRLSSRLRRCRMPRRITGRNLDRFSGVGTYLRRLRSGRSISLLDRLSDSQTGWDRVAQSFRRAHVFGEFLVLDRLAHPARIVMPLEMVQPRRVIHTIGDLHEDAKVLRAQVQRLIRSAEKEALVLTKFAFSVLAGMALGLFGRRMNGDNLWRLVAPVPPDKSLAGFGLLDGKQGRVDGERATESLHRLSYFRSHNEKVFDAL